MKVRLMRILLVAMISMSFTGEAARPLGSPFAEFFKNENKVARGVVVEKLTGNKIAIRVDDYLYQGDDEDMTLKVDTNVFADVIVGTEYVFVFSRLRKNRLVRDEWEVNPDGPGLVQARGLGTPAIYINNAAILALLTSPIRRGELSADAETTLLLRLAESKGDERARELAIFELYLRDDLQGTISGDNADRYATIAVSAEPRLKNFLLQGAGNFPEERRTPWLPNEFRKAVAAHGTELELNSDIPLLIKNSLLGLREEGAVDDLDIIGKHLYSNAPGVAEAALSALDAIDSREALARAQQAVQSDEIHLVTRRNLITYIESTGT